MNFARVLTKTSVCSDHLHIQTVFNAFLRHICDHIQFNISSNNMRGRDFHCLQTHLFHCNLSREKRTKQKQNTNEEYLNINVRGTFEKIYHVFWGNVIYSRFDRKKFEVFVCEFPKLVTHNRSHFVKYKFDWVEIG